MMRENNSKWENTMKKLLLSSALVASTAIAASAESTTYSDLFITEAEPTHVRASDFLGMRVYTSEADVTVTEIEGSQAEWNDIGEINDVIMGRDGGVEAVLVDVGGFLGIGERQVAMNMDAIKFVSDSSTADNDGDFFLVVNAPRTSIEEAPEFTWEEAEASMERAGEEVAQTAENAEQTVEATMNDMANNVEREGYSEVEMEYLTTENLTGARVYDANDDWIGEVSELIVGEQGQISEAIVDVGGFLGIGEKPVALTMDQLDILRQGDGDDVRIFVSATREQLEAMPTFNQ